MPPAGAVPGPRSHPLMQTMRLWHAPVQFQQQVLHRYGEPFALRIYPVGDLVVVSEPDSVAEVLRGNPAVFRAGEANGGILPLLDRDSLLLTDGEQQRRRRRLLMPAFHGPNVARLGDSVAGAMRTAIDRWPAGRPFSLLPSLRSVSLEVILRAVIATPDAVARAELAASVTRMLGGAAGAALWSARDRRRVLGPARIFGKRQTAVHDLVRQELIRRRQSAPPADRPDALDLLLRGSDEHDEPLDDRVICNEVVSLIIAGHETTSAALAWALERLTRHPTVLARARAAAHDGEDTYLGAVVKETLRSRPPLVDAVRRLAAPVTLGGYRLPTGTTVMVSIPLVHHRDDLYPDPARFHPERFAEWRPGAHEWLPFGGGIRRCIGAELATVEMTAALGTVLQHVDLAPSDPRPERVRLWGTALRPARGARVVAQRRSRLVS